MNQPQDRPLGKLFTEVYRERGVPIEDSPRFRVQLQGVFERVFSPRSRAAPHELNDYLKRRAGFVVEAIEGYDHVSYRFDKLISRLPLDELLEFITLVAHYLRDFNHQNWIKIWIDDVGAAFESRNLCYEMDDLGGVHYRVDAAYAHSKALTLTCLAGANFVAAHEAMEDAFDYLTTLPRNNKMAVVNAFLAAENVFKIATGAGDGLSKKTVGDFLMPLVQKLYSDADNAAKQASASLVGSFASWANACHPYRHGQSDPETVAPPDEIAITLVTNGADFIRWLVELSKKPK